MLKEILSISGKPGLYKMISYGKNLLVVENLETKKRIPAYSRDRIVSLGDIAIYTTEEEVPLGKVLEAIRDKYEAKPLELSQYNSDDQLDAFFKGVLPAYDEERVYKSDIRKMMNWYNILINAGITDYSKNEEEEKEDNKEQ